MYDPRQVQREHAGLGFRAGPRIKEKSNFERQRGVSDAATSERDFTRGVGPLPEQ